MLLNIKEQTPCEEIYNIALEAQNYQEARAKLKPLFTNNIHIDIFNEQENTSAAGLHARAGNENAVQILLQFGADIIICLREASAHSQTKLVSMLELFYGIDPTVKDFFGVHPTLKDLEQHAAENSECAYAAARERAHDYIIQNNLPHSTFLNTIAENAALAGDFAFATFLFEKYQAYLFHVANGAVKAGYFHNAQMALYTLVFLSNERFRDELVLELETLHLTYDINEVLTRAKLIQRLQPHTSYLKCVMVDNDGLEAMYNEYQQALETVRRPILTTLDSYRAARRYLFFFSTTPEADNLREKIAAATHQSEVATLLNINQTNKELNSIIQNHRPS